MTENSQRPSPSPRSAAQDAAQHIPTAGDARVHDAAVCDVVTDAAAQAAMPQDASPDDAAVPTAPVRDAVRAGAAIGDAGPRPGDSRPPQGLRPQPAPPPLPPASEATSEGQSVGYTLARIVTFLSVPGFAAGLAVALLAAPYAADPVQARRLGWTVAGAAAVLLLGAVAVRARRFDPRRAQGTENEEDARTQALLACVALLLLCWPLGVHLAGVVAAGQDTVRVAATVTGCDGGGEGASSCLYHWTYQGRPRSQRLSGDGSWPDGHRADVRVDPRHPDGPATTGRPSQADLLLCLPGLLGTVGFGGAWVCSEAGAGRPDE